MKLMSDSFKYKKLLKIFFPLFLLFLLFIFQGCNLPTIFSGPPKYILFISVDTLRADHLGCYGYNRETSPTIDKIAKEGILFENVVCQRGITLPSLASVMTSKYINQHRLRDHIYDNTLKDDKTTLAEYLSRDGYSTRAFSASLLVNPLTGIHQGFKDVTVEIDERKLTNMALNWLKNFTSNKPNEKFFLWLHYMDPHEPYTARKPYIDKFETSYKGSYGNEISFDVTEKMFLEKRNLSKEDLDHIIALYDSQIPRVDDFIREIVEELKRLGIYDKTLLVFFADHGEELYEHNFYIEHHRSVYESVLRIPLVMRYPGKIPANKRVKNVVESIDITPTVLEFCKIYPSEKLSGVSLKPLWEGKKLKKDFGVSEWWNLIFTLRTQDWVYIWNPTGFWPTDSRYSGGEYPVAKEELYNIKLDPKQKNNLVRKNREVADILKIKVMNWMTSTLDKKQWVKEFKIEQKPKLNKKMEEALRSLGYIK